VEAGEGYSVNRKKSAECVLASADFCIKAGAFTPVLEVMKKIQPSQNKMVRIAFLLLNIPYSARKLSKQCKTPPYM